MNELLNQFSVPRVCYYWDPCLDIHVPYMVSEHPWCSPPIPPPIPTPPPPRCHRHLRPVQRSFKRRHRCNTRSNSSALKFSDFISEIEGIGDFAGSSDSSSSSISFIADRTIVIPAWKPQIDPFVFGSFRGIEETEHAVVAAEAKREIATKEMQKESEIVPPMVFPMKIDDDSAVLPQIRPPLHVSASVQPQIRELGFAIGKAAEAGDFMIDGRRRPPRKPPDMVLRDGVPLVVVRSSFDSLLRGMVLCFPVRPPRKPPDPSLRGGVLRFLVVPANRPPAKPPDAASVARRRFLSASSAVSSSLLRRIIFPSENVNGVTVTR